MRLEPDAGQLRHEQTTRTPSGVAKSPTLPLPDASVFDNPGLPSERQRKSRSAVPPKVGAKLPPRLSNIDSNFELLAKEYELVRRWISRLATPNQQVLAERLARLDNATHRHLANEIQSYPIDTATYHQLSRQLGFQLSQTDELEFAGCDDSDAKHPAQKAISVSDEAVSWFYDCFRKLLKRHDQALYSAPLPPYTPESYTHINVSGAVVDKIFLIFPGDKHLGQYLSITAWLKSEHNARFIKLAEIMDMLAMSRQLRLRATPKSVDDIPDDLEDAGEQNLDIILPDFDPSWPEPAPQTPPRRSKASIAHSPKDSPGQAERNIASSLQRHRPHSVQARLEAAFAEETRTDTNTIQKVLSFDDNPPDDWQGDRLSHSSDSSEALDYDGDHDDEPASLNPSMSNQGALCANKRIGSFWPTTQKLVTRTRRLPQPHRHKRSRSSSESELDTDSAQAQARAKFSSYKYKPHSFFSSANESYAPGTESDSDGYEWINKPRGPSPISPLKEMLVPSLPLSAKECDEILHGLADTEHQTDADIAGIETAEREAVIQRQQALLEALSSDADRDLHNMRVHKHALKARPEHIQSAMENLAKIIMNWPDEDKGSRELQKLCRAYLQLSQHGTLQPLKLGWQGQSNLRKLPKGLKTSDLNGFASVWDFGHPYEQARDAQAQHEQTCEADALETLRADEVERRAMEIALAATVDEQGFLVDDDGDTLMAEARPQTRPTAPHTQLTASPSVCVLRLFDGPYKQARRRLNATNPASLTPADCDTAHPPLMPTTA